MQLLSAGTWQDLAAAHAERADTLTQAHRARRAAGERHAVEDFLYTYYPTRPATLRRWHPGAGVGLEPGTDGPAPQTTWRWYVTDPDGLVFLDVDRFLTHRGEAVRFIRRLLSAVSTRPALLGCLGLHEWAMVYRQQVHRHPLPLRLGQAGTDEVVESHPIRCSHFDAYRFFTPQAELLNRVRPTRAAQVEMEQPGCLHAAMDCHKWAAKLGPAVPGDLALDCFELARDVRVLDMQASPYDLSSYGWPAVRIETTEGKAEYVARQRTFAVRAAALRTRLVAVCEALLDDADERCRHEHRPGGDEMPHAQGRTHRPPSHDRPREHVDGGEEQEHAEEPGRSRRGRPPDLQRERPEAAVPAGVVGVDVHQATPAARAEPGPKVLVPAVVRADCATATGRAQPGSSAPWRSRP